MAQGEKLRPLLKAREAEEIEAARTVGEIIRVLEERERLLSSTLSKKEALVKRLRDVTDGAKRNALSSGDPAALSTGSRYLKRLQNEMSSIESEISKRSGDVAKAEERLRLAEQDLVVARVEKKKIEKLLDNRALEEQISVGARQEADLEELQSSRPKR